MIISISTLLTFQLSDFTGFPLGWPPSVLGPRYRHLPNLRDQYLRRLAQNQELAQPRRHGEVRRQVSRRKPGLMPGHVLTSYLSGPTNSAHFKRRLFATFDQNHSLDASAAPFGPAPYLRHIGA